MEAAARRGVAMRSVSEFYAPQVAGQASELQCRADEPARFVVSYGGISERVIPQTVRILEQAAAEADGA